MIRPVKSDDKEKVKKLLNYFPKEVQENLKKEFEQILINIVNGFVYIEGDNIVGYIILRLWGGVFHIDTLIIDPEYQRKGIGKSLIEFAKEKCKEDNIPQINTCTFNESNIPFYEKLGFNIIGNLEGPFVPLDKKRTYLKWINPDYEKE